MLNGSDHPALDDHISDDEAAALQVAFVRTSNFSLFGVAELAMSQVRAHISPWATVVCGELGVGAALGRRGRRREALRGAPGAS